MKAYPIQDGPTVPWAYMAPHESQAQKNHGQSLARLAERGGLGCSEAELIVTAQPLWPKTGEWDHAELKRRWVARAERVNAAHDAFGSETRLRAAMSEIGVSEFRAGWLVDAERIWDDRETTEPDVWAVRCRELLRCILVAHQRAGTDPANPEGL